MTLDDLFGSYAPELDESLGKMVFKFQKGLLVKAVEKEAVLLFDELNLAPSEVLSSLCGLFSSSPSTPFYAGNTQLSKAGAIFVCAMNPAKVGGGRQELPPSLEGVLTTVYLQAFTNEEIRSIVTQSYGQALSDAAQPIGGTYNLQDIVLAIHFGIAAETKQSPHLFNLRTIQNLVAVLKNIEWTTLSDNEETSTLVSAPQACYWHLTALILVYSSPGGLKFRAKAVCFITRNFVEAGVSFGGTPEAVARMWDCRQVEIDVNSRALCIRAQLVTVSTRGESDEVASATAGSVPTVSMDSPHVPTELVFARMQLNDDYFSFAREFKISPVQARQLESVALACKSKRIVLLEGEGVSGKTSLVRQFAWLCSKRLVVVSFNMETEVSDLLGGFAPQVNGLTPEWFGDFQAALAASATTFTSKVIADLVDIATSLEGQVTNIDEIVSRVSTFLLSVQVSPSVKLKNLIVKLKNFVSSANFLPFRFIEGPIILAMRRGYWLLLDNINAARPEIVERINSLGEADASIHMMELGMDQESSVITPHTGFQCFATSTTKRGSAYALSEAFRNRCIIIPCGIMDTLPPVLSASGGEDAEDEEEKPENSPEGRLKLHLQMLLTGSMSHDLISDAVQIHLAALNTKPKEFLCGYKPTFRNLRCAVDMVARGVDIDTALRQAYDTFMPTISPAVRARFARGGSVSTGLMSNSIEGAGELQSLVVASHPNLGSAHVLQPPSSSPGVDVQDAEEAKTVREVLDEHSMQDCITPTLTEYLQDIPAGGGLLDMRVSTVVHSNQELQIVPFGEWNLGQFGGEQVDDGAQAGQLMWHLMSSLRAKNITLCIKKSVDGNHYEVQVADAVVELRSADYPTVTLQLHANIKTIPTTIPAIEMSNSVPSIGLPLERLHELFGGSLLESINLLPWNSIRSLRRNPFQNYRFEVPLDRKPRSEALLTLHSMEPMELGLFRAGVMGTLRVNHLNIKHKLANPLNFDGTPLNPIIDLLSAELCLGPEIKIPLPRTPDQGRYNPRLDYQHFCGPFNDEPTVVNLAEFGSFFSQGAKEAIPGTITVRLGANGADDEVYLGKRKRDGADACGVWWKLHATGDSGTKLPFGLLLSQFKIEFCGDKLESCSLNFYAEASAVITTDDESMLCTLGMTLSREGVVGTNSIEWEIQSTGVGSGTVEEEVDNSQWDDMLARVLRFEANGIKRPSKIVTPAVFTAKWPYDRENCTDTLSIKWTPSDLSWELIPEIGLSIQCLGLQQVSWNSELDDVRGGKLQLTVNMLCGDFDVEALLVEVRAQGRFEIQPPHDKQPLTMIADTTFASLTALVFGPEQLPVKSLETLEPAPVEKVEFPQPIVAYFDGCVECFLTFRVEIEGVACDWCPLPEVLPLVCCKNASIEVTACKSNEHNEGKEEEEEEQGHGRDTWTVALRADLSFYELNMPPVVIRVSPACDGGSCDGVLALRMESGKIAEVNTLGEVLCKLVELKEAPSYLKYPVMTHVTTDTFEVILQSGADRGNCYAEFCFTDWPVFGPSWEAFILSKVALKFVKTGQISTSTLVSELDWDASGSSWPLRCVGTTELKHTTLDNLELNGSVHGEAISLLSVCTTLLFPKLGIPTTTQVPHITFSGVDYQVRVSADEVEFKLQLVGGSWDVEYDPLVSMFRRLIRVDDVSCNAIISNKSGVVNSIKVEGCFLLMGEVQTPVFEMSIQPGCDTWHLSISEDAFKQACDLFKLLPFVCPLAGCFTFGFDTMQMKLKLSEHLNSLNGEMLLKKDVLSILPLEPFGLRLENIQVAFSYNPTKYTWQDRIRGTKLSADLKALGLTMAIHDIEYPPTGSTHFVFVCACVTIIFVGSDAVWKIAASTRNAGSIEGIQMKFATHENSQPLDELLSADYLGAKGAPITDLGVELAFQGDQFQQLLVTVQAGGSAQELLSTFKVQKLSLSILYRGGVDLVRKIHDDGSISEVDPKDGSVTITKTNGSTERIQKKKGEVVPLPDGSTVQVTEDGKIVRNADLHLQDSVGLEFYIDFELELTEQKSVPVRFDPVKFALFLRRANWKDLCHKYLSFALSALTGYFTNLAKLLVRKEVPLQIELFDRAHMLPIWHCTAHTYVEKKIRSPHDKESAVQERVICCDHLARVEHSEEGLLFTMHAMKLQEGETALIIAFRGTIVDDLRNWVVNVTANWTPVYGNAAQVHTGNLNAWKMHLRPLVKRELDKLGSLDKFSRLIFTGHSLGGALATIAAADFAAGTRAAQAVKPPVSPFMEDSSSLWAEHPCWAVPGTVPQISVVTFAQPKCGNHEFVRLYNKLLGGAENHIRFFNFSDVVPAVPNDGFRDGSTKTVVTYPDGSSKVVQAVGPTADASSGDAYAIITKTDDGTITKVAANGKSIEIIAVSGSIIATVKSEKNLHGGCKVTVSDGKKQIELTVTGNEAKAQLPDGRPLEADCASTAETVSLKTTGSWLFKTVTLSAKAGTFERVKTITVVLRTAGNSWWQAPVVSVVLPDNSTEIKVEVSSHPTSPRKVTTTYNYHLEKPERKVSMTTDIVGYVHAGVDICLSGGIGSKLKQLSKRDLLNSHSCALHDEGMRRYYDRKPDIQLPEDVCNVALQLYHEITPLVSPPPSLSLSRTHTLTLSL
jgi:MoxR-like ATPase